MPLPIAIIGAGIGGLTTALTLKQQGFAVAVFESAAELKPVGAGIILASNAMQVLKKLGLAEKLELRGTAISTLKITDAQLQPLSVASLTNFEAQYQVKSLAIHRGELQRVLAQDIGPENIHLAKRLVTIEKGVLCHLTFEDGTTVRAQHVIGADGIKSVVRNQVFGENPIRKANQWCWRGICGIDLPARYHHELNEAWGQGERFGFVPLGPGRVYWYALSTTKTAPDADLRQLFRDFHPDILRIIAATPAGQIVGAEITDLEPLKTWQAGNVCLLGDAAHATTPNLGQGAGQAIEDAYVLGLCLKRQPEMPQAFRQYEQLRRKKATAVVNSSWQIGQLAHIDNRAGAWCRNQVLKRMPKSLNRKQMKMLFSLDYAQC